MTIRANWNEKVGLERHRRLGVALAVSLLAGCGGGEPAEVPEAADMPEMSESADMPEASMPGSSETAAADAMTSPESADASSDAMPSTSEPEPSVTLEGSGETVWAGDPEGQLIAGLDGETYVAYDSRTITAVQGALSRQGVYNGPVNGVLDAPTMEALSQLQEALMLKPTGVPTPMTRDRLEVGEAMESAG